MVVCCSSGGGHGRTAVSETEASERWACIILELVCLWRLDNQPAKHNSASMVVSLSCAGLLAGLWEFPGVRVEGEEERESMWGKIHGQLLGDEALDEADHTYLGLVRQP